MEMVKELLRTSRGQIIFAVIASVCSALAGISVISMLNEMIAAPDLSLTMALKGLGYFTLLFATGLVSQLLLIRLGHGAVYRIRMIMVKRVMDLDLEQLEKVGGHSIYASLTKDIAQIGSAFNSFPFLIYNLVLVTGGFAYLGFLSVELFLATFFFVAIAVLISARLLDRMRDLMKVVRATDDEIFEGYQGVIDGNCEMQLNATRKRLFYQEEVEPAVAKARDTETHADTYWVISKNWGVVALLGLIFSLFFVGEWFGIGTDVVAGFVLVLMFLQSPINNLMADYPDLLKAKVALNKIDALKLPLYQPEFNGTEFDSRVSGEGQALSLENVRYEYADKAGEYSFALGPVDFSIAPGETVFIIGGNGSGKSTLARVLCGLYRAHSGTIRLGGKTLTEENRQWYCSHFSTVFSTFYLFKRLVGPNGKLDQTLADAFLHTLKMDTKVSLDDGRLSDTRLSQGQRKRLALLLARVEERPIWLLDEWAADQDPEFRAYFYLELLPALKQKGISIIAISHDDRYFSLADRIYKCDSGQLTLLEQQKASEAVLNQHAS